MERVRLHDLSTGYGDKIISENLNGALSSGEMTCLLGPNGAGKSTLLRTLSGAQKQKSGEIYINGRAIEDFRAKDLSETIGVVLTERVVLDNMTVEELVGLGRTPYTGFWGRLSDDDRIIVEESIELVKIGNLKHRHVATLSDGERQKAMIAKTIAQNTPIIFLDEPTAFLDFPSKVELVRLLHRLTRLKNLTIFISSHDIELALQVSDKIWLLDRKHGLTIGRAEELSDNGKIGEYFNGDGIEFDCHSRAFKIVKS